MTSKPRAPWAVLLAALAVTSVLAPAASADFESEVSSPEIEISSNAMQSFKTSAGSETTLECTTIALDNAFGEGSSWRAFEVKPTYSSCEDFLGQAVDIDENGCEYIFHLEDNATQGSVDVECPTSTGIQITVGNICRYEIDSQTSLSSISYENIGTSSTREVRLVPNVTGITSTRTTSDFPFLCPNGSSTGTYTGNATVTGSSVSGHVGLFVD